MKFEKTLLVSREDAKTCINYLEHEPANESECLGEDETITHTVKFDDGTEFDVKVCGVQFEEGENITNTAWSEAILCRSGATLAISDPNESFLGDWELEDDDGNVYVVHVQVSQEV